MAYNVYVSCDRCGEDPFVWTNQPVSMRQAKRFVKKEGWTVTGDGRWYCPECWDTVQKTEEIVYGEVFA